MSAARITGKLKRRHPLQRLESPSKGFSGVVHVRYIMNPLRILLIDCSKTGTWSHKLLLFFQIVRHRAPENIIRVGFPADIITVWSTIQTSW